MMAKVGQISRLKILRQAAIGWILDGSDLGEVLLPKNELPPVTEGELEVFLYRDSEDRPVATLRRPYVLPGEFGLLKVVASGRYGAFLDWGLPKDLILPFREQKGVPEKGKRVVVHVSVDEKSDRIVASQRINRFLIHEGPDVAVGQDVDLLLFGKTELGYKAIVDGKYSGLIFANEVFQELYYGDKLRGHVKEVRPDGKLDISVNLPWKEALPDLEGQILQELRARGGFWGLHDKSPAEEIYQELGVSKKVFKRTTGSLFRQRLILFVDGGIRLIESDEG